MCYGENRSFVPRQGFTQGMIVLVGSLHSIHPIYQTHRRLSSSICRIHFPCSLYSQLMLSLSCHFYPRPTRLRRCFLLEMAALSFRLFPFPTIATTRLYFPSILSLPCHHPFRIRIPGRVYTIVRAGMPSLILRSVECGVILLK